MGRDEYKRFKHQCYFWNKRGDYSHEDISEIAYLAGATPQQRAAITRMMRRYEERAYERDLKAGTPEGCW